MQKQVRKSKIQPKFENALKLTLGLFFYILFYFILFTDISKIFHVKVLFRELYIPLLGWFLFFLYGFIFSNIFKRCNFKEIFGKIIIIGLSIHFSALLYKLNHLLTTGSPLSAIYLLYIKSVTICSLSLLIACSLIIFREIFIKRDTIHGHGNLFYAPLILLSIHLLWLYYNINFRSEIILSILIALFIYFMVLNKKILSNLNTFVNDTLLKEKYFVFILFFLAVLVRIVFSLHLLRATGGGYNFVIDSDDGLSYDALALRIAQDPKGTLIGSGLFPAFWDPGYILFLSLIYKLIGYNFYAVTIIQSFINGIIPVATFFIAKEIFSNRIAIISSVLIILNQPLIMHSVVLCPEAIFIPFLCLVMLYFIRYLKGTDEIRNIIFIGIFLGLCLLSKSACIGLPVFMFITVLFLAKHKRFMKKVIDFVFISLISLLIVSPVTILNYLNNNKFNLILDTKARFEINWNAEYGNEDISPGNRRLIEMGVDPVKNGIKKSLLSIVRNPIRFIKIELFILPKRLRNFFLWPNFGFFGPILLVNPSRFANEFGSTMEVYIYVLFLIGLFFTVAEWRLRNILISGMFLIVVYYIFVHALVFKINTVRYRIPIYPYLTIISSVGLSKIFDFVKGCRKTPKA